MGTEGESRRRRRVGVASAALLAVLGAAALRRGGPPPSHVPTATSAPSSGPAPEEPDGEVDAPEAGESGEPRYRIPSGVPANLSCGDAQRIAADVRGSLAYRAPVVAPRQFAEALVEWFDPHGLWSATVDSPVAAVFDAAAPRLLRELAQSDGACPSAQRAGAAVAKWIDALRAEADRGGPPLGGFEAASSPAIDEGTTRRQAVKFARDLGGRFAAAQADPELVSFADTAKERFFPRLDAEGWARVVLAAAVRTYVPLVDPHGDWAPLDEAASLYEIDLEPSAPPALWEKGSRTPLGMRIDSGARAPLQNGDLVLSLGDVAVGGLSVEAVDQLALAVADGPSEAGAVVLRAGEAHPIHLDVPLDERGEDTPQGVDLPHERVRFGESDVLAVGVRSVREDLGEQFARLLRDERSDARPIAGLLVDLRGNGGGSTDGAAAFLGALLPGVPLCPMKRGNGTLEVDRAPEPPAVDRFSGPVALLVDGNSASAAEMIAGTIASYHRGVVLGTRTFGKGCAQEYEDDSVHRGVLRLTTFLYALPDGAPVQRVGLTPTFRFAMARLPDEDPEGETEGDLPSAAPSWRGPDVRDRAVVARLDAERAADWPRSDGPIGPCVDPEVCRAVAFLSVKPGETALATPSRTGVGASAATRARARGGGRGPDGAGGATHR